MAMNKTVKKIFTHEAYYILVHELPLKDDRNK